jgi:hypothetical protein
MFLPRQLFTFVTAAKSGDHLLLGALCDQLITPA